VQAVPQLVETLSAGDFAAAMRLLDRAFAEHDVADFASLLPALYQPTDTHMNRQLAVRDGDRLVALLGVFPIEWRLGELVLPVAGIGGVSVDPDHRGRGLMRRLMDAARARIAAAGYPLAYLAGQRQRYRWFGWEVAGCRVRLELSRRNLAAIDPAAPTVSLLPLAPGDVAALEALHRLQPSRCERADFAAHLRNWRHTAFVARCPDGIVGYLVVRERDRSVFELVARTPELQIEVLRAYASRHAKRVTVLLPREPSPLLARLTAEAEVVALEPDGNWWVRDWGRVAGALLAYRHARESLPRGEVVLRCDDQTFRLWVDASGAGASPSSAPSSLTLAGPTLTRLLFGPLPPDAVTALSAAAEPLRSWCPLPLAIPRQDQV
jgi:predicted N-acetyltransferase YhbS